MIARIWRGWIRTEDTAKYVEYIERTGLAEYRATPGNSGAQMLTRNLGDGRTEVLTLSWWLKLADIEAFAGKDISAAKYYPEDDRFLIERDDVVGHFEVTE